jgi:hypothetical protein
MLLKCFAAMWSEKSFRRKYFEKYAKSNGFDPLDPEMWYKYAKKGISTFTV